MAPQDRSLVSLVPLHLGGRAWCVAYHKHPAGLETDCGGKGISANGILRPLHAAVVWHMKVATREYTIFSSLKMSKVSNH